MGGSRKRMNSRKEFSEENKLVVRLPVREPSSEVAEHLIAEILGGALGLRCFGMESVGDKKSTALVAMVKSPMSWVSSSASQAEKWRRLPATLRSEFY